MNLNCPICNQAGLPDYRIKHTICPQCNSDLKAYLLLNTIKRRKRLSSFNIVLLSFIGLGTILFVFYISNNTITHNHELTAYEKRIKILEDSLSNYANVKSNLRTDLKNEQLIIYKVRKGDCPWKIAVIFYGNGKKYKLIEQENNLQKPYKLKIGQQIKIKFNQK